jgi:predicted 3-demethylubiquinone-9 3-methyltransferase (glyoxalase superfamily)
MASRYFKNISFPFLLVDSRIVRGVRGAGAGLVPARLQFVRIASCGFVLQKRCAASDSLEIGSRQARRYPAGSVMTVAFELDGQPFTALDGGPEFQFNEAISFQVFCDTQDEIDNYWNRLSEGGDENAQQCGWLKDQFGVSWQIVPAKLPEMVGDPESPNSERAMKAMLQMKKLDIAALERAYAGQDALASTGE